MKFESEKGDDWFQVGYSPTLVALKHVRGA